MAIEEAVTVYGVASLIVQFSLRKQPEVLLTRECSMAGPPGGIRVHESSMAYAGMDAAHRLTYKQNRVNQIELSVPKRYPLSSCRWVGIEFVALFCHINMLIVSGCKRSNIYDVPLTCPAVWF